MNHPLRISEFLASETLCEPPREYRVPLVEAGAFACKFIIGDPDEKAICCGAPTDGKSWCPWHRRIVFEPRKPGRIR